MSFVFGEMWLRPGLSIPIMSHVDAALKSRDISFDEMDEVALHFAAYYGWPKAYHLSHVIGEQKERVLAEWRAEVATA